MRPAARFGLVVVVFAMCTPAASAAPPPLGTYNCSSYAGVGWYGTLKIKPDKHYKWINGHSGAKDGTGKFKMTAPKKFKFTSGPFHAENKFQNAYKARWSRSDGDVIIDLIPIGGWAGMSCF